ncbi:MAG TPA: hypothetical protein VF550_15840, partial [Polyangia bacterium]
MEPGSAQDGRPTNHEDSLEHLVLDTQSPNDVLLLIRVKPRETTCTQWLTVLDRNRVAQELPAT